MSRTTEHPAILADGDCRTTTWAARNITWDDVTGWLDRPGSTKQCGGYVLGRFDGHDTGSVHRTKSTFVSSWAVKLDAERGGGVDLDLIENLENLGIEAVAHTTASSTAEETRWRFLLLADRDLDRDELALVTAALEDDLGSDNFDTSAGQGERFMYLPAVGTDGSYKHHVFHGEPLDVDEWVQAGRDLEAQQAPSPVATPAPARRPSGTAIASDQVGAWVEKVTESMDDLAQKPTGEAVRYRGKTVGWDTGFFLMGIDLAKISNSSEGAFPIDQAEAVFLDHAPSREEGFDPHHKWSDAVRAVGDETIPAWQSASDARNELGYSPHSAHDLDLAMNMADRGLRDRFRYTTGLGWLEYHGGRWDPACVEQRVMTAIGGHVPDMLKEWGSAGVDEKQIRNLASTRSTTKARGVMAMLEGVLLVPDEDLLDAHPNLLNVRNGTVDLTTGELLEHDRAHLLTKITDVDYTRGAHHDDWDAVLEAVPDQETRDWLRLKFGQAITGHPATDEAVAILKGGGSNGKSLLLDSILNAVGDHGVAISPRVLTGSSSDHPTEKMALRGARLAVSEELPDGRHLNEVTIKQLVGTERITARMMRQDNVEFKATHSFFVTTNYDLQVSGSDDGTWRRFQLIEFSLKYVREDPRPGTMERVGDPLLKKRMRNQAQRQAVLAWLVTGAVQVNQEHDGITPGPSSEVTAATDAWRASADVIYAYSSEKTIPDPGAVVLTDDLYADFCDWHEARGGKRMTMNTFTGKFLGAAIVRQHGIDKTRTMLRVEPSRPGTDYGHEAEQGKRARIVRGLRFA